MNQSTPTPRRIRSGSKLLLLASAALAVSAPLAYAQTAPTPAPDAQSIGEIVVTAQRREERLQNVPAAVSAFSANQLQQLNISSTKDLTQVTPGLNFTQSVYSPQPTIRGVGSRGVNAGEESEVPIYVDGVYQSFLPGADMAFNDVDRIEVLKGPQGALYGRNAMGGAINIVTRTPTADPHMDASVSYGSYNQVIGKAYVSGGTDTIAAGLAFVGDRDDGYIHDLVNGRKYGQVGDYSLRGKVVVHPSEQVDLTVAAGYTNNDESTGEAFRNLNGNTVVASVPGVINATAPYTAALSFRPYNDTIQWTASATAVFHASAFDVTAITAYQNNYLRISADADGTPLPAVSYFYGQYSKNAYNEIYATSKGTSPFSWIAGFVYYHDDSGNPQNVNINVGPTALQYSDETVTDSYAGYVQGSYKFTDQWSATLAGRYTSETKSFSDSSIFGSTTGDATFSKFTPSGVLQYQPTSDLNFYFKGGEAFKSGVFNPGLTPSNTPIQPETLTQYELGMKAHVNSKLSLNLAAYYTDYSNLQSATRTPSGLSILQNAGAATIYGFEAEAFIHPIDHLNIRLGLQGLHGTYSNYTNADVYFPTTTGTPATNLCATAAGAPVGGNSEESCNVNGKTIMRTPTFTTNLGGDYTIPMTTGDVTISANAYYQGVSYWDAANVFEEHPYTLVDARIAWRSPDRRYGVSVWGENLGDALYSVTEVVGAFGTSQVLAKPRTFGVELNTRW
jgi:iron complex outermembrane receptor protein